MAYCISSDIVSGSEGTFRIITSLFEPFSITSAEPVIEHPLIIKDIDSR
ncbi:hypothetical protein OAP70_00660 [Flavobacteriaceae bacterium]|nr:hypothetical protein [Flavobacteriaceae bacterium]MDC0879027.1 hypothetical protein [Flavobacteriaceae bacterium]